MKNNIFLIFVVLLFITSNINSQSTQMDGLVNRINSINLFNHRYDSVPIIKDLFDELRDSLESKYFTESSAFISRYQHILDSIFFKWGPDRIN